MDTNQTATSTLTTNAVISEDWDTGYKLEVDLKAESNSTDWKLDFNLPYTIKETYGVDLIDNGNGSYTIKGQDYNKDLGTGQSTKAILIIDDGGKEALLPDFNSSEMPSEPQPEIPSEPQPEMPSEPQPEMPSEPNPISGSPQTATSTLTTNAVISEDWDTGYKLEVDLKAESNSTDWKLDFNLPYTIKETYGVDLIDNGNGSYTIKGQDYNKDLGIGQSTKAILIIDDGGKEALLPDFNSSEMPSEPQPEIPSEPQPEMPSEPNPISGSPQEGQFAYGEALQKSFLFFEANRAGVLPKDNRIEWRSDSATQDGSDVGRDLSGGYYDAGDHVKFGLPMAANNTMLAWGGVEYTEAYKAAGQFDELLEAVKWGTDYFIKAHVAEGGKTKEFYVQVGDGNADHAFWGRPEDMTMARPSFKVNAAHPGSDAAASTASALASASMLFRGVDNQYADQLLQNAQQLFEFADTYRGKYSDAVPEANPFYTSFSGYADELAEGAAWLYKATGEKQYLDRAEEIFDNEIGGIGDWTWAADDKSYSAAIILAQESDDPKYQQQVEGWLDRWISGNENIKYSSGGLAHRAPWGSLSLSSSASFLAGLYNDTVKQDSKYTKFATQQVDYILGDNPRDFSYMIGFGDNYAQQPHHRASSGNSPYGQPNEHILYGALVGGPKSTNDFDYSDDRNDWITNEVATGYNAPLHSALIQQYDDFGGDPLTEQQLDALIGVDANGVGF